jgi:hypothetical protein
MKMAEINDRVFDVRILEMELRDGTLTEKEIQKFLKSLPDREDQGDEVQIPLPGQRGGSSGEDRGK